MPLAVDGVLYYSGSYNQVYALDGATGEVIWHYAEAQRGPGRQADPLAVQPRHRHRIRQRLHGHARRQAGRDRHEDRQAQLWETKLIDSEKLTVGFTGAPLLVKDKVIIGAQGGEWPDRGPIFGVDAQDRQKKCGVLHGRRQRGSQGDARNTWGNDSWKTGGGGGWMAGAYDPETNTVWWGTANPAPLYDWSGADWKTRGARPGDNLYTTSVIAARSRHRQAEVLPSGAAARRLGLRQLPSASSS